MQENLRQEKEALQKVDSIPMRLHESASKRLVQRWHAKPSGWVRSVLVGAGTASDVEDDEVLTSHVHGDVVDRDRPNGPFGRTMVRMAVHDELGTVHPDGAGEPA
jgi:hypothetical protein